MKPFTAVFSPGHTPTAPGATRGNVTEYGLSSAIIGDMIFRLSKLGHTAHLIGSNTNSAQVRRINKIAPDFGLELHFNNMASQPDWNGTMCLYYPGSKKGYDLASTINQKIVRAIGTASRGLHPAHYQLNPKKKIITIVKRSNCPFIVVEPLYFSNADDFERIDIPAISIAIVRGCVEYWEELG